MREKIEMSVLAILGSSRSEGNTRTLLDYVLAGRTATRIDLKQLNLTHYDYDLPSDRDDFPQVAAALQEHSTLLFATPVYWYAMSGRMKVLFDRLTDLLHDDSLYCDHSLKGRRVYLLATGTKPELPEGFEVPFRDTAAYLGMTYQGALYACMRVEGKILPADRQNANRFAERLFAHSETHANELNDDA